MITVYATHNPFNSESRIRFMAESALVSDLIKFLPQAVRDREANIAVFIDNRSREVSSEDWGTTMVEDGDTVSFIVLPAIPAPLWVAPWVVAMINTTLVSIAISLIGSLLFKPKLNARARDDESSPTYNWRGFMSNRRPGQPVEVLYGEMRVAGTMIGEYIRSNPSPVKSTLYQLISFGWGPFDSIAGVETDTPEGTQLAGSFLTKLFINDNPVENIDGVSVQVRMGSNEQNPILGFHAIRTQIATAGYSLDSYASTDLQPHLTDPVSSGQFNLDQPYGATNDAHWATYARTEDITTEIDAARIVIDCTGGAYAQGNSGELLPVEFKYQVRYRELDALNNPITTGGYAGDGWVRLPVGFGDGTTPQFAQIGAFRFDIDVPLYDPQTWNAPVLGSCGSNSTTIGSHLVATAPAGTTNGVGKDITSSLWFMVTNEPTGARVDLIDCMNTIGGPHGWQIYLLRQSGGLYDGMWRLVARLNVGGIRLFGPYLPWSEYSGSWHHAALVGVQIGPRMRLYFDRNEVDWANLEMKTSNTDMLIGTVISGATGAVFFDDVRVWEEALSPTQIQVLASPVTSVSFPRLVTERAFWDFESAAGENITPTPDQWWGDLSTTGGTLFAPLGIVPVVGLSTPKRMKIRLEVVRITKNTTNTRTQDTYEWNAYQRVIDEKLIYPKRALLAIEADATEQLNGSKLDVSAVNRGVPVPVWDGDSLTIPSAPIIYSSNPAWIFLDIATNKLYGAGHRFKLTDVVSHELKRLADHCDEVVYDGYATFGLTSDVVNDIWYDHTTQDANGQTVGSLEFRIAPSVSSAFPSEWVVGGYVRIRDIADDSPTDIYVNLNTPGDSDGNGSGGYEIFEIGAEATGAYIFIRAYYRIETGTGTGMKEPWLLANGGVSSYMSTTGAQLDGGTLEGGEKRFEYNGVFDQSRGMWDAMQEVLSVCRAAPRRVGKKLRLRFSRALDPVALIDAAKIKKDSFKIVYHDVRERPNAFDLQIRDKRNLYKNRIVRVQDDAINNPTDLSEIRVESKELIGVTTAGQASRGGNYEILVNKLLDCSGEFVCGPSALDLEVGDIMYISGDLISRGEGGRLMQSSFGTLIDPLTDSDDFSGAAWLTTFANSSALSTPLDPFGDQTNTLADSNSSQLGYVYQQITTAGLSVDVYCASVVVRASVSDKVRLGIMGDSEHWAAFDLTLGAVLVESNASSVVSKIQAIGSSGWYLLSVSAVVRGGTATFRFYPACGSTGEDATAVGNCYVSKPNFTRGRYAVHDGWGDRSFVIDHPLTLSGSEIVTFQGLDDSIVSGTIDGTISPAGDYDAGDVIFLGAAVVGVSLERHASYLIADSGDELMAEIVSTRITDGLDKKIEWVKYDPAVFNDRSDDHTTIQISDETNAGKGMEGGLPDRVAIHTMTDLTVRSMGGVFETRLRLAWNVSGERLAKNVVWVRPASQRARWAEMGAFSGQDSFAEVVLSAVSPGDALEVAVQPVSYDGTRRRPEYCEVFSYTMKGIAVTPQTLSNLAARVQGRNARFTWTLDDSDPTVVVECRRGGWVLGDRVFVTAPGAVVHGPTENWAGDDSGAITLYFRTRNAAGFYSPVTTLSLVMDPDKLDPILAEVTAPTETWESFVAAGWETPSPPVGDPFIGTEFSQDGSGNLVWDVASVATTEETVYTTSTPFAYPVSGATEEPREYYVDAYFVAIQKALVERGDAGYDWDDPELDRYESEGIISLLPGEGEGQLWCEMRINTDGSASGWTAWQRYQPGTYSLVDIQFRLQATRPSTSFNMELSSFHTRILAPFMSLEQRTQQRSFVEQELF